MTYLSNAMTHRCEKCGDDVMEIDQKRCPHCGSFDVVRKLREKRPAKRSEVNEPERQRLLIDGLDCLPGQLDLF